MFTVDNTQGYSQDELDELNRRLHDRIAAVQHTLDDLARHGDSYAVSDILHGLKWEVRNAYDTERAQSGVAVIGYGAFP